MVEADRGEHGHVGVDEVRGVQAPAEADLEDRHLHAALAEDQQRREGVVLEEGERGRAARLLDALERCDQGGIVCVHPGHADAFVVAHEVR